MKTDRNLLHQMSSFVVIALVSPHCCPMFVWLMSVCQPVCHLVRLSFALFKLDLKRSIKWVRGSDEEDEVDDVTKVNCDRQATFCGGHGVISFFFFFFCFNFFSFCHFHQESQFRFTLYPTAANPTTPLKNDITRSLTGCIWKLCEKN